MMDVSMAISEHVVQRLEDSFGKAVALLIIASATSTAKVPTGELSAGEYQRLVEAICGDARILDMWGEAGAEQAREQWVNLV